MISKQINISLNRFLLLLLSLSPTFTCLYKYNYLHFYLHTKHSSIYNWDMGFKSIFLGFATLLCLFGAAVSQSSIPTAADGFWYGQDTAEGEEKVFIEAFFDPVCPDSRDSWPPLKKVVDEYASRVSLVVHTFPLPWVNINLLFRIYYLLGRIWPAFVKRKEMLVFVELFMIYFCAWY